MQLAATKEGQMRTGTLSAPVIGTQRRLTSPPRRVLPAPGRRFELDREELIRSIEITDDEILDDLLYPADHRAVRPGGWAPGHHELR
jgi:hypothetical protein